MAPDDKSIKQRNLVSDAAEAYEDEGAKINVSAVKAGPPRNLRKQLAVMPTAILLPDFGNLKLLTTARLSIERHLKNLQSENLSPIERSDKERLSEESMLNQVLQWLSLGRGEK